MRGLVMAVNRQTLRLMRQLRIKVGGEADEATRTLTRAWVRAWDELSTQVRAALADVVAEAVRLGRWPQPWELARVERLQAALAAAERALIALGQHAGITVSDAAGRIVHVTGGTEPHLIASQLPAAQQADAVARFTAKILPTALDAIVARTQSRIVGQARVLVAAADER
jgi:hypothetical protein